MPSTTSRLLRDNDDQCQECGYEEFVGVKRRTEDGLLRGIICARCGALTFDLEVSHVETTE